MNDIGQRTGLSADGSAFVTKPSLAWSYNQRGELVSAANATTGSQDRAYRYDTIGNRIEAVAGTTTLTGTANYVSNSQNQYTQIPGSADDPVYDSDGNLTNDGQMLYRWDAENRLITTEADNLYTYYEYDYLGRRMAKLTTECSTSHIGEFSFTTCPSAPAHRVQYFYDGWNCIAEDWFRDSGATQGTKHYTCGLDLSGSMQGAGGLLSVTESLAAGAPSYYPSYDGNGNVSEYLDQSGAVVAHFEYDPFGNTSVESGLSPETFDIRFSTKKQDVETGLYYYGYRYYDAEKGRWLNRDPLGENWSTGEFNEYAFVLNRGVYAVDYLGMSISWPSIYTGGGLEYNRAIRDWFSDKKASNPTPTPTPTDGTGSVLAGKDQVPCPDPKKEMKLTIKTTKGFNLSGKASGKTSGKTSEVVAKILGNINLEFGGEASASTDVEREFTATMPGPGKEKSIWCYCIYEEYKTKSVTVLGETFTFKGPTIGLTPVFVGAVPYPHGICPDCDSKKPAAPAPPKAQIVK